MRMRGVLRRLVTYQGWLYAANVFVWSLSYVMPLVGGFFVLVFGGLTIWLQDDTFIKLKPTIVNCLFGIILGGGLLFFKRPLLKPIFGDGIGTFSALSAGIVVGVLITPLIASISDDAMRAVPRGLREGAFAMGATKFEVVRQIVFPAALSGIMASIILAISRAIGETMAVVLAGGTQPQFTLIPLESVQSMTAFIVQISLGDTPQGSVQFKALFAVAATLFTMTLVLNLISNRIVRRFRIQY